MNSHKSIRLKLHKKKYDGMRLQSVVTLNQVKREC